MGELIKSILFLLFFIRKAHMLLEDFANGEDMPASTVMFWPNATIPFYIVPEHFDLQQSNDIMTTLALVAFKTCLKFVPSLTYPDGGTHALVFANPDGVRSCVHSLKGHSLDEPHIVILGYECLRSPHIDMEIMRALGFPFEHNRPSRNMYVNVLFENIHPSAVELFTMDSKLPLELRSLAYDVDSVTHFGEREYSINGHRTIIFKDILTGKQNRNGLSATDLKKIELVYGPECRKRDRLEKVEMCQNYPGIARRKREVENDVNLRVNREITPPPGISDNLSDTLKELGVEDEVQEVVDHVYKVSVKALKNARSKYCNTTAAELRTSDERVLRNNTNADLLGIIEAISDYTQNMVNNAMTNLTHFCLATENIELYQRIGPRCPFYGGADCPQTYRSTKTGGVRYSTQHRPVIPQSTKHSGNPYKYRGYALRDSVGNDSNSTGSSRRRREVDANADGRKRDDVTRVLIHRSRDDDDRREVQARRDDVTRVKVERSRDDEAARNDDSSRKKIEVITQEKTNEEITAKSEGKVENTTATGSSLQVALRAGTLVTPKDSAVYEVEWPFSERNHRRINKKRPKDYSRPKNEWEDSRVSLETKPPSLEEDAWSEPEVAPKPKKKPRVGKKKPKRSQRQKEREDSSDDVVFSQLHQEEDYDKLEVPPITVPLSKANKEFYSERMWPEGVVRYVLKEIPGHDMADVRRRLDEVNDILKDKTCARIQEITETEAEGFTDYLVIDNSADYVTGRVGGRQNFGCLELFRGSQHRQHTAMVVMAMLGFYFELARHDRDKYVRVHLRHVRADKLHHFEKIRADATFPLAYDYASATHPAWQFWRKVGKTGISTVATFKSRDPRGNLMKSLGQNQNLLSELDLVKINTVYGTRCFQRKGRLRRGKGGLRARTNEPNKNV